jgi:hypothetical protein
LSTLLLLAVVVLAVTGLEIPMAVVVVLEALHHQ